MLPANVLFGVSKEIGSQFFQLWCNPFAFIPYTSNVAPAKPLDPDSEEDVFALSDTAKRFLQHAAE